MKTLSLTSALLVAIPLAAQTPVSKTLPVQSWQKISIQFDYPELVMLSTWEKNEILIEGSVSINGGENDEAFRLETSTSANTITIRNEIQNLEDLPKRITIMREGQKIIFRNKAEWQKFRDEHGGGYDMMNQGVDMDIRLQIKVPQNMETMVESVYGMVEIRDFTGPLQVEATYGGVDAAIAENATGELTAETNYGHIYSNLDTKFEGGMQDEDFHTSVSFKPGTGPRYSLESRYGNVYLRKKN